MLEVVSNGFNQAKNRLQGRVELTESNIADALSDIRLSLLEADVHLSVAKAYLSRVKEKALGAIVQTRVAHDGRKIKVTATDHFIRICYDELVALMGPVDVDIAFGSRPVSAIMLLGLQGCGKTTTAGKLGRYLAARQKKPLLVAADIYRPAAVEQLRVVGSTLNLPVFFEPNLSPPEICSRSMEYARSIGCNIVIFDTAGRLAVDDALMTELDHIASLTHPENILLVCDAMIGQDAVKTAEAFNRRLALSGFIMTKLDGDARGGAALSIKEITGKSIKFLGTGESLEGLEEFRPEGLASRILGFGDVVGLMKDFEEVVDEKEAEEDARRMLQGQFTLKDFLEQIKTIKKMGPLQGLIDKIPFFSQMSGGSSVDENELIKVEAIINSMTSQERLHPDIILDSRKKRIALGSGRTIRDVNEILKRFKMMRTAMKNIGRSGLLGKVTGGFSPLQGAGNLPDMSGMLGGGLPATASQGPRDLSSTQKKKVKLKRKLAKKARKKSRKR